MDVAKIAEELRGLGTADRREHEKRYLKSDFVHYGVPVPQIRKAAVTAARTRRTRAETLALAEALWAVTPPVHELRMAAIEVLIKQVALLEPADLAVAERFVRDSRSWVYVDGLAEKVVGALVLRDPPLAATLDRWAADPYLWIRRTAVLALLAGIRAGTPDRERIARYGDLMIEEPEFFIRKALGWVLRELSKKDPDWVRSWVGDRIEVISGVTLREAVRRLPRPEAEALLASRQRRVR